jgi:RND family efflux transporter MFP subunit
MRARPVAHISSLPTFAGLAAIRPVVRCARETRTPEAQKVAQMIDLRIRAAVVATLLLAGCNEEPPAAPPPRPVRTITVQPGVSGETVSATGQIRAQQEVNLAFRIDGRLIERTINVGDTVTAGQVIGRLDPQIQRNGLRQAEANLSSAQGVLTEARATFERQRQLVADGFATRARYDQAQRDLQSAEAQVNAAQAQLRTAREQLDFTELRASAPGAVIAVGAWPGEVVSAGRMVVQVALDGGRDAVFDVSAQIINRGPRDPVVELALTEDPTVTAIGYVREQAPQADQATRTYRVKVGISDPPPAMRLGATVTGRVQMGATPGIQIPASALMSANGNAAVWIVAPQSHAVSLRNVTVLRYEPTTVSISQGLEPGDVVVTAGVHALHPGQQVRLLEQAQAR